MKEVLRGVTVSFFVTFFHLLLEQRSFVIVTGTWKRSNALQLKVTEKRKSIQCCHSSQDWP